MQHKGTTAPTIDPGLYAGVDVGGTKVSILDSSNETFHRYRSNDFDSVESILDEYFAKLGKRPAGVALAMAGPRDDETGTVKLTNLDWPAFNPLEAEKRYPGTTFETINDMIGTAAGAFSEGSVDLEALKPGTPPQTGTKLVITVSTGIGAAAAVWDKHTRRYVFMASEGGHIGIQPENEEEAAYLKYLQTKYTHVSTEIALSGLAGVDSLIEHVLGQSPTERLAPAIERARKAGRPVGAVLLEFATEGEGNDKEIAQRILSQMGNMLGSAIRDLVVAFKSTGGVYLTGSISLALGEYFASETDFLKRFVHKGAAHDTWIEKIPVYLVTDPHVAVKGALSVAQQLGKE